MLIALGRLVLEPVRHSLFFRIVCQIVKYCLLFLVGFTVACWLGMTIGGFQIVAMLLMWVAPWLLRLTMVAAALFIVAVVVESLR